VGGLRLALMQAKKEQRSWKLPRMKPKGEAYKYRLYPNDGET
jgi:hypothetical protein